MPLAEMFGYATALRSATQGRGTFTMEFDHYEPVPADRREAGAGQIVGHDRRSFANRLIARICQAGVSV